jgi:hypothetical protein
MNKNLRFSHKILLAAALIVIAAFASFTCTTTGYSAMRSAMT